MNFNKSFSIPKSELYPTDCLEHIKTLKLRTLSKGVPDITQTFKSLITIGNLTKTPEGKLKFEILDTKFDCGSLKPNIRLRCESQWGTIKNITLQGLEIYSKDIAGLRCRATGYVNYVQDTFLLRSWSECFTSSGADCEESQGLLIGMSCGGSVLLLAMIAVVTSSLMYRRKAVVVHTIPTDLSPSHIVIKKTENTKEDIYIAADSQVITYK